MPKRAVSVTLDADNLHWLRGQARATKARGLSAALDRLVAAARQADRLDARGMHSVVGTIEVSEDDPALDRADEHVRALFGTSGTRRPGPPRRRGGRRRNVSRGV